MRKGMGALFLIGVGIFILLVMNLFIYLVIGIFWSGTENIYYLSVQLNDEGSELKSFMKSSTTEKNVMRLAGEAALLEGEHLASLKQSISDILFLSDIECLRVYESNPENPKYKIGTCPEDMDHGSVADVPLPGAMEDNFKIKAEIV